jgi:hypothetical protein
MNVIALEILNQPNHSFYQSSKAYKLKTKHQPLSFPISLNKKSWEKG